MTELHHYINSYFGISPEDMSQVSALFEASELKKGEYYLKAGQHCERMSFVTEGFIRIYAHKGDKEVTQWIAPKGPFIIDMYSFNFRQPARWNIQALTDCKLYTINRENYTKLHSLVPNWADMEKQFIASCFVAIEDRIFQHLSLSAEERYDHLFEQNKELFNHVPLQYIASMLGMTPETFSRIRSKKNP